MNIICGLYYGILVVIYNLFLVVIILKIYEDLKSIEGLKKLLEFCLLVYLLSLINNWWIICGKYMDKIIVWFKLFRKVLSILFFCLLCKYYVKFCFIIVERI